MITLGLLGFFVKRDITNHSDSNDNYKTWWNKQSDTMKKLYARDYNKSPNQLSDKEIRTIHFENQ